MCQRKGQGKNTRNTMQYNQSNSLFSCYASASQKAITIYKLEGGSTGNPEAPSCEHTNTTTTTVDATCTEAGSTTVTCDDCGETVSTEEIDKLVYDMTTEMGGIPAPLNYDGFPKSVCTSINEVVCHGIPSADRILEEGDIVNVDVSTIYNGYFSDSSRMFCIGKVDAEKEKLVRVARECIDLGLEQVKPWGFLGDVGQAIHDFARKNGYSVVREIGGHGIGLEFHEEPFVSYVSKNGTEMLMVPGMIFTIEPMINMGRGAIYMDKENDWVVYTADGMPSAQWEIQVLVTNDGYEVLAY